LSAVDFLGRHNDNGSLNLALRAKKYRELDQKLFDAKTKLIEFANAIDEDETIPMEYLLQ
jgi:hypothetical protein